MPKVAKKIQKTCELLKEFSVIPLFDVTGLEAVQCGYKEDNTPPASGWQPMTYLVGEHTHYWVRGKFRTPAAEPGYRYMLNFHTGVSGWDAMNPQGLLYLNGKMVQGLDTNHMEAFLEPDQEYEMHIYFYTGVAKGPFPLDITVVKLDPQTEGLYYDLEVPREALDFLNENTAEYQDTLSCLEQAVNLLDLRCPHSAEYDASILAARAFMADEFYGKLCSTEGKPVVHCIGHTHIDVEWQWARKQTREKMQRSFSSAKALMDKYPEYLFTLSQPELYRYLKEEAPEKYEELKELVAQGRWEPEGAMWVECDCNLVSGESFVRQILQGKKFFRDEFGKESRVLFLPDVFGYSASLPQILKKSGVDYFITSKISWNDTNTLPYDSFQWEGIDGTEIFTSFITSEPAQKNHESTRGTTYVSTITPSHVMGAWDRYQQKEFNKHTLLTFGFGDGGGGPTRLMLEMYERLKKGLPGLPVAKIDFVVPYLQAAEKEFMENSAKLHRMPKWVGELYLEYHRGTYTSQAKVKRGNRKSELALQKAEALSYTDLFHGGSYDADGLYTSWRKVLHDQFHDILPGSSIEEVYQGTDEDYAKLGTWFNKTVSDKLAAISGRVSSDGGILVYNPLGFERGGSVTVDGKCVELTKPVPAFGWTVISAPDSDCSVQVSGLAAENPFYRVTLDEAGRIVSLFDKETDREVVLPGQAANEFQVFEDYSYEYDAWELSDYYKSKMTVLDSPAEIEAVTDGTRAGFRVTRKYMDSTIRQNIWLYSHSRRIDFDNDIDWHNKHQIMKVAFPIDVHTDRAAYEIQFGHVYRPTHENTSWDAAKFEVCAHKWMDVSENGYGVSLLNDCKYGFNTEGSTMKLTALKCPSYPDPHADEGNHVFSYALVPHCGSLYDAGIPKEAHSFNQPMESVRVAAGTGDLPAQFSMVSCDAPNVILETVKKAEVGDDMVVRMYEAHNSRCKATVTVPAGFTAVCLCDLMENELEELPFDGHSVTVPAKNFEIITLKFKR